MYFHLWYHNLFVFMGSFHLFSYLHLYHHSTYHPFYLKSTVVFCSLTLIVFCLAGYGLDGDEPYPSLSDYHDYEPNLEFDDTELHQSPDAIAHTGDDYLFLIISRSCGLLIC